MRSMRVVEPVVRAHGAEVVDLEFKPDRGGWVLRVYVEKAGAAANRLVDARRGGRPRALRQRLARPQPRARRGRPHPPRVPPRGELAGRRAAAPRTSETSSASPGQKAKLKLREPVDGQRVLVGTARRASQDGSVRVERGGRASTRCRSRSVESARLVFEFGQPKRASTRSTEQTAASSGKHRGSNMAIQQQQTARRPHPPSSDRDGREGQGDRQDAARQDGRGGHPQGRPERVRPEPRARGPLQRGQRPGRPLPVHDRRRRRGGRRSRDRDRGRAASGPRGRDGRGARLPDLLAPVGREEGRRAGQGVRRHPAREAGAPGLRPHRRADGEAGAHPARPRRGAGPHLQRVQGPQGGAHQGRRPAVREGQQPHRRPRPHRGHPALPRADAARDLPPGRPHRRLREGHRPRGARPAGHPQPQRSAPRREALREPRSRRSTRASSRSSPAPASRAPARRSP